jgi:hypothetical protein
MQPLTIKTLMSKARASSKYGNGNRDVINKRNILETFEKDEVSNIYIDSWGVKTSHLSSKLMLWMTLAKCCSDGTTLFLHTNRDWRKSYGSIAGFRHNISNWISYNYDDDLKLMKTNLCREFENTYISDYID